MKDLENLIAKTSKISNYHHLDVNQAWDEFDKLMNANDGLNDTNKSNFRRNTFIGLGLVALVVLVYLFLPKEKFATINTADFQENIEMVDGSTINLGENTTVTYPVSLKDAKERRVIIDGQATFEISPNKDLPFIVEYGDLSVRVLGTIFHVSDTEKGKTVENIEGKVKAFETGNEANSIILLAGDKVLYSNTGFTDITPRVMPGKDMSFYDIYAALYDRSKGKIYLAGTSDIDNKDTIPIDITKSIEEIFSELESKTNFKYNKMKNGEIAILEFSKK